MCGTWCMPRLAQTQICAIELNRAKAATHIDLIERFAAEEVGKVVCAVGHGTDEDTDALLGPEVRNIIPYADDRGVEAERDLAAVRR